MTTANKITIARIVLVPFFVGLALYYARTGQAWFRLGAFLAFAITAISDGVDGYIARHYNQRSELGAVLDPLADKLLLTSAVIFLSLDNRPYFDRIPLWLTLTVLGRDAIMLLGMVVIHLTLGRVQVRARMIGKIATVVLMALVMWILLGWNARVLAWLEWVAGGCGGVAALLYILDGVRQLNSHPSSAAAPSQNRD